MTNLVFAATAFMGFFGHAVNGDFDPAWAVPLSVITIAGGLIGGRFVLKTKLYEWRLKNVRQLLFQY
jgi:uncharacterized membrane protein YfcA